VLVTLAKLLWWRALVLCWELLLFYWFS
jgi:hypothetical protein